MWFDMDQYWPISIFLPKLPMWQDIATISAIIIFWLALKATWFKDAAINKIIPLGILLIIGTNLLQGIYDGFSKPIAGTGPSDHQYWQDVDTMTNPSSLLRQYEVLQPNLEMHSRVHPPGPMLLIYYLRQTIHNPEVISLLFAVACGAAAWMLWDILRHNVSNTTASFVSMLLVLIPASQIYAIATVDIVIAMLFLSTYWAWQKNSFL